MKRRTKFSIVYYVAVLSSILLADYFLFSSVSRSTEISYSEFRRRIESGRVESVAIGDDRIDGVMKAPASEGKAARPRVTTPRRTTPWRLRSAEEEEKLKQERDRHFSVVPVTDAKLLDLLDAHHVDYRKEARSSWLVDLVLNWILPFGVMFFLWGIIMKSMGRGPSALTFGRNRATIYEADPATKVTFADVAGIDEAVEEVREIVDFLEKPERFSRLGAKLPKGVLLVGPPGTGKTLLARAIAGEARVPFFSLGGSDFVEMFVGVGAARVRDLFRQAKAVAPCIIFIDELDALGRARGGAPNWGGHDERESTLTQLLSEMDGFDQKSAIIIIIGATNRPEVLDAALLRPGRFDRHVLVDRPDLNGRVSIFGLHAGRLRLAGDVDLRRLAGMTPGFAGADIANVCNEAALLASRKGRDSVALADFQEAIERVIGGLEKKSRLINPRERRVVSYHESGHALVNYLTPGADPVRKVSIVPRGVSALGYTIQSPLEDRYLMTRTELLEKIKGLLGGRAAEEIVFGEVGTGASDDLEKASRIAHDMLRVYGMSRRLPNLSFHDRHSSPFLGLEAPHERRSEKIEQILDEEVQEIVASCYEEDRRLLTDKRAELERMAQLLLEKETLTEEDVRDILGPRPTG